MATIGLRVNQGPTLNLSDIFKSATADPDTVMKLELAKSKIWNDYYQNQVYQQQAEEQRQLGIKTGQEAADLKARADALGVASPAYGDILANAVPEVAMPVPVTGAPLGDLPGLNPGQAGAFAGAAPGIVAPENYDARVKQRAIDQENWRKVAPAIVRSSTSAADLTSGLGKGLGEVGLSAPSTPEAARRSAILYTGNLPSKDTVVTAGDYAGTDAAARQSIQEAAGKPIIINNQAYMLQPDGSYRKVAGVDPNPIFGGDVGKARQIVAEGDAWLATHDGKFSSAEQQAIYNQAKQAVNAADLTAVPKGSSLVMATSTGVAPAPGAPAPPPEDTGMLAGLSNNDAAFLRKMLDVSVKMRSDPNYIPDEQTLQEFDVGNSQVFLQGKEIIEPSKVRIPEQGIEIGDPIKIKVTPALVPSLISPQELYARAGKPYPGAAAAPAAPVAGGTAVPVTPSPAAGGPVTPADPLATMASGGGLAPVTGGIVATPNGYDIAPGQAAPAAAPGAVVAPNAAAAVAGQARTANGQPVDVGQAVNDVSSLGYRNGGVYVQKLANGSGSPATEAEGKLRGFGGRAVFGTAYLDQIVGGKDIPDPLTQYFNNPANGDLTSAYIQSIADPGTKQYMAFATYFLTAVLRKESGAAITPAEFLMYGEFIPKPGDNPDMLRARKEARHQFIRDTFRDGYTTDARGRQAAEDDAANFNVKLAPDYGSIPLTPEMADLQKATNAAAAGQPPPGFVEAGHTLQDWIDLGTDGRAQFNALGKKGP